MHRLLVVLLLLLALPALATREVDRLALVVKDVDALQGLVSELRARGNEARYWCLEQTLQQIHDGVSRHLSGRFAVAVPAAVRCGDATGTGVRPGVVLTPWERQRLAVLAQRLAVLAAYVASLEDAPASDARSARLRPVGTRDDGARAGRWFDYALLEGDVRAISQFVTALLQAPITGAPAVPLMKGVP